MPALETRDQSPLAILIVDDHPLFVEGLSLAIHRCYPNATLDSAANLASAQEYLVNHADIDIMLLDLCLPDGHGLSLLSFMRAQRLAIPTIMLSASEDTGDIAAAVAAGADGFINKSAGGAHIVQGINRVLDGHAVWPESFDPQQEETTLPHLSPRQQQVLELLAEGLPNKEICRRLALSNHTVKTHIKALYHNLGVHSRTECVKVGIQSGLIHAITKI